MKKRVPRDTRHTVASSRPLTIDVSWPHPVSPGGVIMRAACPTATLNRERLVAMVVVDSQVDPFDLDALAVSDRFRLFGFTRRDDYLAYLWVLRAIDRRRGGGPGRVRRRTRHRPRESDQPSVSARQPHRRRGPAPPRGCLAGGQPGQVPEPAVGLPVQRARTPRIRGGGGRARGAGAGREPVLWG